MAITALTVTTDRSHYSRYERDRSAILATVTAAGGAANDPVTVTLQRRGAAGTVATLQTQSGVLPATPTDPLSFTFDLAALVDADGFSLARSSQAQDDYTILAEAGAVQGAAHVSVVPITVEELKARYLFGLPLQSQGVLMPRLQPQVVTGVQVTSVSPETPSGGASLVYTQGSPSTLAWAGGEAIPLSPSVSQYLLPDAETSYIMVRVDHAALPGASKTEKLFIEQAEMSEKTLVHDIVDAHDGIQRRLRFFVEPTVIVSERILASATAPAWWDVEGTPMGFFAEDYLSRWPEMKIPHPLVLKIRELSGWVNKDKAVLLPSHLIVETKKTGVVHLVPSNHMIAQWELTSVGLALFMSARIMVPNFWHYHIVAGLPAMPPDIIDKVAKRAALDVLARAGVAKTGGVTSGSLSRDGVSESVSYQGSPYAALMEQYRADVEPDPRTGKDPLGSLRRKLVGLSFVTL